MLTLFSALAWMDRISASKRPIDCASTVWYEIDGFTKCANAVIMAIVICLNYKQTYVKNPIFKIIKNVPLGLNHMVDYTGIKEGSVSLDGLLNDL